MVNKWLGIGNLGNDVEMRYTQDGMAVASFSIACTERWKDKDGQQQEETEWVNCTAFNRLAEVCGEYLSKGSKVYCEGKLKTKKYQAADGSDRYSTGVVLRNMQMLSPRNKSNNNQQPQSSPPVGSDIPF